jgi:hypothetical protein
MFRLKGTSLEGALGPKGEGRVVACRSDWKMVNIG